MNSQIIISLVSFALLLFVGFCGAIDCGKRQWPPSDPESLKDPLTSTYDVRINPYVAPEAYVQNALCSFGAYYQQKNNKKVDGDCFQQTALARPQFDAEAFDYYPQPVDHFRILEDVRSGKPVDEAPQFDSQLTILKKPKTCKKEHNVVIMIESCVQCGKARENSRKTFLNPKVWSNVKVGWVFVTGIPPRELVKRFYFPNMTVENRNFFPEGTNKQVLFSNFLKEASSQGDILVGDYEEDGYHQVWAYILSLRWASAFCNKKVPMFVYMQGHFAVMPPKFIEWLNALPADQKPRFYGGLVYEGVSVNHDVSKSWGYSWEEMPWPSYPPITERFFTLLGHDTVQDAAIMSAYARYSRILSAYIAILNRRVRIHPTNVNGVYNDVQNSEEAQNAIAAPLSSANRFIDWSTGKVK